ncbi:putative membrane protein [hydrothermal vent metagenome]|uniref:Putative membrane protein n=1 Tax=hydrothermal vent metagenome TaxID=652676 RepID=A0A3B0YSQ5_9ZZZZ
MDVLNFVELNTATVIILFLVGFIGGMVSGFIGSGGAFVLTPAMMSLGAPAIVAVASNMAHKFPKALVGSIKRARYGQVDVKLGLIMGLFAEVGVIFGKQIMTGIRSSYGDVGTDLYVSLVFIVVLAVVGGFIFRDALKSRRAEAAGELDTDNPKTPKLALWVQSIHIPGTMMRFKSIGNKEVSLIFIAPLGFATGLLAASIAVGGFIGVPAMIYVLGVPAIMATATELVVAFVMGLGGSLLYAWDGFVDIRLSLLILCGSLFGVQIGAIGTTYVKEHTVKFVMGMIMLIVLVSRLFKMPVYLSDLNIMKTIGDGFRSVLNILSFSTLVLALATGAIIILAAIVKGMIAHRRDTEKERDARYLAKEIAETNAES